MTRKFEDDLAYSEAASEEPFWQAVYEKAFPSMVNCMLGSGDTDSQRQGVDRVILLSNGRILKIDEKKRRKVYNDINLEYLSSDVSGAPGWMEKELVIDYLSYAFMPIRTVYLFDWLLLQRAWRRYKERWKEKYFHPVSDNITYKTHSVAVPIDVVQKACSIAAVIKV